MSSDSTGLENHSLEGPSQSALHWSQSLSMFRSPHVCSFLFSTGGARRMCAGSLGTSASACFSVKGTTACCSSPKSFQGSCPLLYPDIRSFWNRHMVLLSLQGETQDSPAGRRDQWHHWRESTKCGDTRKDDQVVTSLCRWPFPSNSLECLARFLGVRTLQEAPKSPLPSLPLGSKPTWGPF